MGFKIVAVDGGYRVKLADEPSWVRGLSTGDSIDVVGDGACLVIAFSAWSTPDREAAYRAVEIAKTQKASVRICLLPYDYPEEMGAWLPSEMKTPSLVVGESRRHQDGVRVNISQDGEDSPIWFTVHDGQTINIRRGPLRDDEIVRLLFTVSV